MIRIPALVGLLLLAGGVQAAYPDDCLGPATPSAEVCPPALSYDGCCDDQGRVVYCQSGKLYCLDCPELSPSCGWSPGKEYNCGTDGTPDPSGFTSPVCNLCDPACPEGKTCQQGQCQLCTPECGEKECGFDGCGGSCGTCPEGTWCSKDKTCVASAQCPYVTPLACGQTITGTTAGLKDQLSGYACSKNDVSGGERAFVVTPDVDQMVRFDLKAAQGTFLFMHLTHSQCTPPACFISKYELLEVPLVGGQTYFLILDGATEEAGEFTLELTCQSTCEPDCGGKNCGPDGCFGICGGCEEPAQCHQGQCFANDGCTPTYLKGCVGCVCEDCVCESDSWCCGVAWDEACVNRCEVDCGGCGLAAYCGDETCQADENCGDCPQDCPCSAGQHCVDNACICLPTCEGKECGFDGCGGECGTCEGAQTFCVQGTCICQPQCGGALCGDDGCGGTCGVCDEGQTCTGGLCLGSPDIATPDIVLDVPVIDIGPEPTEEKPASDSGCCAGGANGPLGFVLGILFSLLISWAFARRRA